MIPTKPLILFKAKTMSDELNINKPKINEKSAIYFIFIRFTGPFWLSMKFPTFFPQIIEKYRNSNSTHNSMFSIYGTIHFLKLNAYYFNTEIIQDILAMLVASQFSSSWFMVSVV